MTRDMKKRAIGLDESRMRETSGRVNGWVVVSVASEVLFVRFASYDNGLKWRRRQAGVSRNLLPL
jgi:hypothetical protein